MKTYECPSMTVEIFETSDVITASVLILSTGAPAENERMTVTYNELWK